MKLPSLKLNPTSRATQTRHPSCLRRFAVAALELVVAWLILRSGSIAAPPATAEGPAKPAALDDEVGKDWVRVRYDKKRSPLAMETAIVRYELKDGDAAASSKGLTVDLVAAVHVGDAAYYDALNKKFESYDALLYELVAPEGTVVEKGRGTSNAHPLGAVQNGMKTMLALEHQLEKVDYTKKNFVHADMSPEQFLQAMKDRNEGFLQMYMRLLGHTLGAQSEMMANGESPDVAIFAALFADDRPLRLKKVLAQQLADTEEMLTSFGGEEGSVLISDRNQAALKVLCREIAAGKKHLAIFYGAGHLSDMDKRLRADFGLKPVEITWLTAWNLDPQR